jgi:enoyl-CoA hydratase/carnithine racemase
MQDRILIDRSGGVAHVRLNRPDKLNALDPLMFEALIETGLSLSADPSVRAIALSGEGKAFCAGLDMGRFEQIKTHDAGAQSVSHELRLGPRQYGPANQAQYAALVWRELPVPVVAAIHGVAFGGGLQVALAADLRLVSAQARLSVMEIRWGLVADMGGTLLLPELVRADLARDLLYTGRIVDGQEAVSLGLATRLVEDPVADALRMAHDIAQRSPDAIRAAKRLLNAPAQRAALQQLQAESNEQITLLGSPNQREAVMANLEKRPPNFSDPGSR